MHNSTALFPNPEVTEAVHDYSIEQSTPLPPHIIKHREDTIEYCAKHDNDAIMMISPLEAQLLIFLVKLTGAKKILEVGMFTGFSALAWAHALRDTPDAHITALDLAGPNTEFAKEAFTKYGVTDRITVIPAPAGESLEKLDGQYDFIFVDADKGGYIDYLETILRRDLLAPKGLIIADNTLNRGLVVETEKAKLHPLYSSTPGARAMSNVKHIQKFNAFVAAHPDLENVLMPIFDGLTLIRRK